MRSFLKRNTIVLLVISLALLTGCNNVKSPHVQSENLYDSWQQKIEETRIIGVLQYLVEASPRIAGTKEEEAAGEYLYKEFINLGFDSTKEFFPIKSFKSNNIELEINNSGSVMKLDATTLVYSPSTSSQGLEGIPLIIAGTGHQRELNTIDMKNSVAIVYRGGDISFKDKVLNCYQQGALAVICINTDDTPLMATLQEPTPIPAVGLSLSEGRKMVEVLSNNNSASVSLIVDTTTTDAVSNNIIGMKKSNNSNGKTLIIGAHYDSVDCPGANDNASGVGAMMELATVLRDEQLPFDIKFIAFGAEEIGLVGSRYHVTSNGLGGKREQIIGMINMDMVGNGSSLAVMRQSPNSSSKLSDIILNAAKALNINHVTEWSGRSDHAPFEEARIPVVFLAYGPVNPIYYHTPKDTMDIIDINLVKNTAKVVLRTIFTISQDL